MRKIKRVIKKLNKLTDLAENLKSKKLSKKLIINFIELKISIKGLNKNSISLSNFLCF